MGETKWHVGSEIAKIKSDIFVGRTGESFSLPNTDREIGQIKVPMFQPSNHIP